MSNETFGQKIKKKLYPFFKTLGKGKYGNKIENGHSIKPIESFYDLSIELNNGKQFNFSELKGKKVLLVNTASDCGFTAQYDELQKLYEQYNNKIEIIAFPANDFGGQEKGSDEKISEFCRINYGVTFPLAKKGVVVKKDTQQSVFQWLSNKDKNGWLDQAPEWNFSKYLIDEEGKLLSYYGSSVSPLDADITDQLK